MDGPGSFAHAVRGFGHPEGGGAVQVCVQISARLKAIMNAVHQAFAHLVGKAVAFEDDSVVIIQWFDKVHIMTKRGDKGLECVDGLAK